MSQQKCDRKFRLTSADYACTMAAALRESFGTQRSSAKAVAGVSGANERAARNWLDGKNGPNGCHLIWLMHHSDSVLLTVLSLAERRELVERLNIETVWVQIQELVDRVVRAGAQGSSRTPRARE